MDLLSVPASPFFLSRPPPPLPAGGRTRRGGGGGGNAALRVVVLGGGFAGSIVAKRLDLTPGYHVTLIDPRDFFEDVTVQVGTHIIRGHIMLAPDDVEVTRGSHQI